MNAECPDCRTAIADPVVIGCNHTRCTECWTRYMKTKLMTKYQLLARETLSMKDAMTIYCPGELIMLSEDEEEHCKQTIDIHSAALLCGEAGETVVDLWDEVISSVSRYDREYKLANASGVAAEEATTVVHESLNSDDHASSNETSSELCHQETDRGIDLEARMNRIRYSYGGREVWSANCLAARWPSVFESIRPPQGDDAADIIAFFLNLRKLNRKDNIHTILSHLKCDKETAAMSSWSEHSHHYIADVFPTIQRSSINSSSPTVDDETITYFTSQNKLGFFLRKMYRRCFLAFARFLGFTIEFSKTSSEDDLYPDYEYILPSRSWRPDWLQFWNHNLMRISRIVESLRVLGFRSELRVWSKLLQQVFLYHRRMITQTTWRFWEKHMYEEDLKC